MSRELRRTNFWKREQQWESVSFFFFRNSWLRALTLSEIRRSVEVVRSSIIVFLNLADCDTCTCMQCSDKVTGTFIGTLKCKCMHVHVYEPLMTGYMGFLANCMAWAAGKLALF